MKNLVKITVLFVFILGAITVNAQNKFKLGFVNSDSLMLIMPGVDSANTLLQKEYKTYQTQLSAMQTEFNQKLSEFQATSASMPEVVKQTKTSELQDMNARIESFTAKADTAFQKKKAELFKPLQQKAVKAIDEVAKENGYTYIFDSAIGTFLYKSESDNIMGLVKKKLNIKK